MRADLTYILLPYSTRVQVPEAWPHLYFFFFVFYRVVRRRRLLLSKASEMSKQK